MVRRTVGGVCHPAAMKPKSLIRGTAYVVGFVWSSATALAGLQFEDNWIKALTFLPLVLVLLFMAWDRLIWRLKPIIKYVGVPDLNGTWLGEYESVRVDPCQRVELTGPAAITVNQTFTTLSVKLMTGESKSYSVLSHITHLESGEFRINYEYANTPLLKFRQKMPSHLGSAELTIASARGRELTGEYWTNRMSQGTLSLVWVSSKIASTLQAAQELTDNREERDT